MRAGELQNPVDVHELMLYDAQLFLRCNPHIVSESAYDDKEYRSKINAEKAHTIQANKLVKHSQYYIAEILGIPVGKYINIRTTEYPLMFMDTVQNKLWFRSPQKRDITFPATDQEMGDQCTDILIYDNINDKNSFLSALKLTYADWRYKINNI